MRIEHLLNYGSVFYTKFFYMIYESSCNVTRNTKNISEVKNDGVLQRKAP
jgi:hypothetical protein